MPTYDHGVAGLTGTIGVTVLNADGTAHDARATAGITEPVAGSGIYHIAHPHPGTLLLFIFDGGVGTVGGSCFDDGLTTMPARAGDAMTLTAAYDAAKDDVLTPLAVVDGKVDAAAAAAAVGYIDGDTLITQATLDTGGAAIGRTTAGATVTAYLSTDTSRATPKRQGVADEDGDWSLYLTGGSTYTLVFAKSGYSEATAEVTVA
jgi:hypothetical protein